jgi:glutamate/aspartate transport system permease protein
MEYFNAEALLRGVPYLWSGLKYTLLLTLVATVIGVILGSLLALARLSSSPTLSRTASVYVDFMRSTPLVLVIFWVFFVGPLLLQWVTGQERPIPISANIAAFVTFSIFEAAYFSEIIRSGIQGIPRGQIYASQAMGFTQSQSMRFVVLPQAFRRVMPVLLTQVINLFQDTSLVYVISATDFLGAASKLAQRDGEITTMYTFVAITYFLICFVLSKLTKIVHAKNLHA